MMKLVFRPVRRASFGVVCVPETSVVDSVTILIQFSLPLFAYFHISRRLQSAFWLYVDRCGPCLLGRRKWFLFLLKVKADQNSSDKDLLFWRQVHNVTNELLVFFANSSYVFFVISPSKAPFLFVLQ